MLQVRKTRKSGKGDNQTVRTFTLAIATTMADVQAMDASQPSVTTHVTDVNGNKIKLDLSYAVYCFNYGHDLVTRSKDTDKVSATERRAKTLAWVTTQPEMFAKLVEVQLAAAKARSTKPADDWFDAVYAEHTDDIEDHAEQAS